MIEPCIGFRAEVICSVWRGAKVSARLAFAVGKEYNKRRFGKRFLKCVLWHRRIPQDIRHRADLVGVSSWSGRVFSGSLELGWENGWSKILLLNSNLELKLKKPKPFIRRGTLRQWIKRSIIMSF